jgi:hypothetical protein
MDGETTRQTNRADLLPDPLPARASDCPLEAPRAAHFVALPCILAHRSAREGGTLDRTEAFAGFRTRAK